MIHHYRIDYKNVILRPLEKDDIEPLREWRNDPRNTQYLSKIPYITPELQIAWFEKYLQNRDELSFAIVENKDLNRLVGSLCLYNFSLESCLFGKILIGDPEAHGRKIGLNATVAATKIAFEQLKLKQVDLYVYSDHAAALAIYKKAGFFIVDEHKVDNGKLEYKMTNHRRNSNYEFKKCKDD